LSLRKSYALSLIFLSPALSLNFAGSARADCVPESSVPVCLSGVAIASNYAGALITQPEKPGIRRVHKGDTVDDWTVGEIGARYVVFTRHGDSVRIDLTKNDAPGVSDAKGESETEAPTDTDNPTESDNPTDAATPKAPTDFDARKQPSHHPRRD
jgi:hypothetical protein